MAITAISTEKSAISWLYQMRRGAFVGQLMIVAAAELIFGLPLPVVSLVALCLAVPATEVISRWLMASKAVSQLTAQAGLLLCDTALLSGMLYLTGGPSNPLSLLYIVHVVLAAVLLNSQWTWALALLTSALYFLLFFFHVPIAVLHHSHHSGEADGLSSHLYAMFISHVLTTFLVAYFLTRILGAFRSAQEAMQKIESDHRQLALMTTLSANVAHELGTPLSTISLVLDELATSSPVLNSGSEAVKQDLALMAGEVQRCKLLLTNFSAQTGSVAADKPSWVSVEDVFESLNADEPELFSRVHYSNSSSGAFHIQLAPLKIALKALIVNARQASIDSAEVSLTARHSPDGLVFTVKDSGCGMSEADLEQALNPFFSLKKDGMGLGLYLTELVARQFGGSLRLSSELGKGTQAIFAITCRNKPLLPVQKGA
jgi:two-component system, sensor histidine kinase RegB